MFWKKKDYSDTIENIALQLISSGHETGSLPFLYLKDAANYAKNCKASQPAITDKFVKCHSGIDGGYYDIEFRPHPEKGVYISVWKFN